MQAQTHGILQKYCKNTINNFVATAYNNVVEEITITQNGFPSQYMSYLFAKVKERFSFLPAEFDFTHTGDTAQIECKTERAYSPYVRKYAEEHIGDVIAIGYKYAYFEKTIRLPLLTQAQRRLLFTALVSADYQEDKAFVMRQIRGNGAYCLDGVFHFRLRELQGRWEDIANYVPTDMSGSALDGFLGFLVDDGTGKVFVKDGKVYDENYRVLSKSLLTGEQSIVGEVLLGGAERVYCFGEVEKNTEKFLKKYYAEKATFC